jgi:S1-C subfamily serine protease
VSNPDEAGRLVVHQVEPGSTADLHELHFGSQVMTVDGQRIQTLSQLEAIARRAMAAKRDLRLILRTVDSDGAPTETYWVRDLPIDEVDWYPK